MLATGHTTKGIHLGNITGRIIAHYIFNDISDVTVETDAFLPSRIADFADVKGKNRFFVTALSKDHAEPCADPSKNEPQHPPLLTDWHLSEGRWCRIGGRKDLTRGRPDCLR